MKRRAFLTACLTALAGCAATEGSSVSGKNIGEGVERFVDEEAGVVVYIYKDYDAGGVSIVPIENTHLQS